MSVMHTKDELHLWKRWKENRDQTAADILVRKYTPLVHFHVQRILISLPKNVLKDDLISQGLFGLFDALDKFDITKEIKFDTYASFRIRGSIIDYLRKEDWLSRSSREKTKKLEAVIEQLEQKHMRTVSTKEIAESLSVSEDEVYSAINESYFANVLSIDELANDLDSETEQKGYIIRDHREKNPEDQFLDKERISDLINVISSEMNDREKIILDLFYREELTFTEIASILDITTSRVSQIHSRSLLKLRNTLKSIDKS
ncbi:MAG: FliA/WhiG family polymerase sigma factor [Bacillales bacterium]|jgi:RNA polymerase sigma factor for flagellar operon FliA|nr:FliA/WhiG family polymerase sigma factor [Bacillales bacterium]